jgi:hypothetical protein
MADKSILFNLLSLVRSDPSFGLGHTAGLYRRYKAREIHIDADRLSKILPMLCVARFEPNPNLRELMRSLWNKLIAPSAQKGIIDANISDILKYASSKLCSAQWREREAACFALESLLPKRSWPTVGPFMDEMWLQGFRILDDVRISTRAAALDYMKVALLRTSLPC